MADSVGSGGDFEEDERRELQQQITQLKKAIAKAERESERVREDKDDVEERLTAEIQEREDTYRRAAKKDADKLARNEATFLQKIDKLEKQLQNQKVHNETVSNQLDDTANKTADLSKMNTALKVEIENLEAKVNQAVEDGLRQVDRVQNEKELLEERIIEIKNQFSADLRQAKKDNETNFELFSEEKSKSDSAFNERLEKLHDELANQEQVINKVHGETEHVNQQLVASQRGHDDLKDTMERLIGTHRKTLEESAHEAARIRQEKEALKAQSETQRQTHKDALAEAEGRYNELLSVVKDEKKQMEAELIAQVDDLGKAKEGQEEQASQAQRDLENALIELEESRRAKDMLELNLADLKSSHEKALAESRSTSGRLQAEKDILDKEITRLHEKHSNNLQEKQVQHSQNMKAFIADKEKGDGDYNEQLERLREDLNKQEQEKSEIRLIVQDELKDKDETIENERQKTEQVILEKEAIQARLDQVKKASDARIEELLKQHDSAKNSLQSDKEKQIVQLQNQVEDLRKQLIDEKKTATQLVVEIEELNSSHTTQLEDSQAANQRLILEKAALESRLVEQRESFEENIKNIEEQQKENLRFFQTEKEKLEANSVSRIEELNARLKEQQQELVEAQNMLQKAQHELAEEKRQSTSKQLEHEQLLSNSNAQIEDSRREVERIKSENEIHVQEINSMKQQHLEDIQNAHNEYKENLQAILDEKKRGDARFEARVDELSQQLQEAERDNSQMKIKMNELYKKTENVLKEAQRDASKLQTEKQVLIERLESQNELFKNQMVSVKEDHQQAIERMQDEMAKAENSTNDKIQELNNQITEYENSLQQGNEEVAQLKAQNHELERKMGNYEVQIQSLSDQSEKAKAEIDSVGALSKQRSEALNSRITSLKSSHHEELAVARDEFKKNLQIFNDAKERSDALSKQKEESMLARQVEAEQRVNEMEDELEKSDQRNQEQQRKIQSLDLQTESVNEANKQAIQDARRETERAVAEKDRITSLLATQKKTFKQNLAQTQDDFSADMKIFQDAKEKSEASTNAAMEDLKQQISRSDEERASTRDQIENLHLELTEAQRSNTSLLFKINNLQEEAERQTARYEADNNAMHNRCVKKTEQLLKVQEQQKILQFKFTALERGQSAYSIAYDAPDALDRERRPLGYSSPLISPRGSPAIDDHSLS